jgi:hypothetical protein
LASGPFKSKKSGTAFTEHVAHVLGLSSQEQMSWARARRIVATMKDTFSARDFTAMKDPRQTVGGNRFAGVTDAAIAHARKAAFPSPASASLEYVSRKYRIERLVFGPSPIAKQLTKSNSLVRLNLKRFSTLDASSRFSAPPRGIGAYAATKLALTPLNVARTGMESEAAGATADGEGRFHPWHFEPGA